MKKELLSIFSMDDTINPTPAEKQPQFSDSLQDFVKGVRSRRPFSMAAAVVIAFFVLPLCWLCIGLAHYKGWVHIKPIMGFVWGIVLFPLLFGFVFFLYPLFRKGPFCQLTEKGILLDQGKTQTFSTQIPFNGSILYQEKEQMALLVLHNIEGQTLYFVGYYSKEYPLPQKVLPLSSLLFSLQQTATEQVGAWILPSLSKETFPALVHYLWNHPRFRKNPKLPLKKNHHVLRFDSDYLSWFYQEEPFRKFPYESLILQPLTYYSGSIQAHYLLYQVESYTTQAEHSSQETALPSLMIAVEWPTVLDLSPLPKATKEMTQKAILLNAVEFLLFAQALYFKNAISSPLSILERFQQS